MTDKEVDERYEAYMADVGIENLAKQRMNDKELKVMSPAEIEQWLLNRFGRGNKFEEFNRGFCHDLCQAQIDSIRQKEEG